MTLSSAAVLAQAITILGTPILSRVYDPHDFGVFGAFAALLSIGAAVATLRYETAILLPENRASAAGIMLLAIILATVVGAIVGITMAAFGGELAAILGVSGLASWAWILGPAVTLSGVYSAFIHWGIRNDALWRVAAGKLSQALGSLSGKVALGLVGWGGAGLILGAVLGQIVGVAVASSRAPLREHRLSKIGACWFREGLVVARQYNDFPRYGLALAVLDRISPQLPVFVLGAVFGAVPVGLYVVSYRLLQLPGQLLGEALSKLVLRKIAGDQVRGRVPSFAMNRILLGVLALIAPLMLGVAVAGPALFGILLGSPWSEAGHYARWLSAWVLTSVLLTPVSAGCIAIRRQDLLLRWGIARVLLRSIALIAGSLVGSPVQAVAAYGVVGTTLNIAMLLSLRAVLRNAGREGPDGFQDPLREPKMD